MDERNPTQATEFLATLYPEIEGYIEVRIIGNKGLTYKQLTKEMVIKPTNWLSWMTDTDTYDREKLLFDQAQLRHAYLNNGYARVRVDSSVAELTPDRGAFVITHTVHEGERFKFGPVSIDGNFKELPKETLQAALRITEGEWYSRKKVRDAIERLTGMIGDFGYAFLDIRPGIAIKDEAKVVAVMFQVDKGRRVYVNRVEVVGNTRTRDAVIRREVVMSEGDRFSASRMRISKNRLKSLNFFETVEITTPSTVDPERVDVRVKVEEKATGTFSVGAGFSSQDAFIGTASVSQNNFLGKGQRVVLSTAYSSSKTEFDFSFTEPYFMGKSLAFGVDLYNRRRDQSDISSFKQNTYGGALRLGFPISNHLRDTLSYQFSHVDISPVGTILSASILAQAARSPYVQSMVSNSLVWNNVNNAIFPTRGRMHRLITDLSGLGGDVKFARLVTDHQGYFPVLENSEDWVVHLRGRVGVAEGLGEDIPLFERFFLGGNRSVRGFKQAGIGPRTADGDAYGGVHFEQANGELFFPLPGLKEYGIRGLAYVDSGYLGDWDLPSDVINSGTIRVSTGVGLMWNSPFGLMQITVGTPLSKASYDETRIFDFTMGGTL